MDMAPQQLESAGWKPRTLPGFIENAGPLWTRREADGWAYAFVCEARHLNPAQRVHGGALMTLLDHAISSVAWEATGRRPCVTLQLDSQFLAAVEAGQFAEARARVTHQTRGLVFMQGTVSVGAQDVLVAQAILKILPA